MRHFFKKQPVTPASKQELRRGRLLFFLLLTGFIATGSLYVWGHLPRADSAARSPDARVVIAGKRPTDAARPEASQSKTAAPSMDDPHATASHASFSPKAAEAIAAQFIRQFFTYDEANPFQHIVDIRTITDAGFYQALSEAQTDDTHVSTDAERTITQVTTQTPQTDGDITTVHATMRVTTFTAKHQRMGQETDTVRVDLKTEKGKLKVFYVASSLDN